MRNFPAAPAACALWCLTLAGGSGCATPPYAERDGPTASFLDRAVRYGGIGAAGAGGFLAVNAATGSPAAGAAAGLGAGGLAYAANLYSDRRRQQAYANGLQDGAAQARAEIVQEKWRREAVYGLADPDRGAAQPVSRRVYVPSRTVNGVLYPGAYQHVEVLPP